MAKVICPRCDALNEHWKQINELSVDIFNLKKEIIEQQQKKVALNTLQSSQSMASKFLASVHHKESLVVSKVDTSKSRKKRALEKSYGGHIDTDTAESSLKIITLDAYESSTSSSMEDSKKGGEVSI